ncbi:MAG: mechanosensitive ion channel [Euryarchaeota archaeon]|nr:mechanosensitive ion channel [Euryarchaeota archaeon]
MRFKRALILLLVGAIFLAMLSGVNARSIDVEYHGAREIIHRGDSPIYLNYTLTNLFNRTLVVEIDVPYSEEYSVKFVPAESFTLKPYGVQKVSIILHPAKNLERAELDLTIKFAIYEVDGVNPIETKESHVTILLINPAWFIQPIITWLGQDQNWVGQFIITVVFWLGIGLLTVFVIAPIVRKITEKTKTKIDDIIWKIIRVPIIVMLFLYGFVAAADLLPIGATALYYINKLYEITLILVITYLAYRIFHDLMLYEGKKLANRTASELDDILIPVIEKIGDILILIAGFLWLLTAMDINITIFLAGLGGLGLIIGLASQDALSNFFAGMHILLDHPFSIGDYIKLEGINTVYRIEKVGVRSTQAYDVFNHEMVIIPNRLLANDKIINMMKPDEMGKVKFTVGVAYGSDVDRVMKVIEEVVNEHPEIVKIGDRKPLVRLTNFGDSSLDFLIIAWIPNIMDQWRVAHELRIALYNKFREEGIEIPFPQLDVYVKDMPTP